MTAGFSPLAGTTIGIVGAGMMGGAIAYTCARAGADVVLVARTLDSARRGKSYAARREARAREAGTTDAARSQALLDRIMPTERAADLCSAAWVVEAVAEDVGVKHEVLQTIEAVTGQRAVLASTTSTLPITTLAAKLAHPRELRWDALLFARGPDGAGRDCRGRRGADGFTSRAHELAARYGDRFLPPEPPPQTHDQSEFS